MITNISSGLLNNSHGTLDAKMLMNEFGQLYDSTKYTHGSAVMVNEQNMPIAEWGFEEGALNGYFELKIFCDVLDTVTYPYAMLTLEVYEDGNLISYDEGDNVNGEIVIYCRQDTYYHGAAVYLMFKQDKQYSFVLRTRGTGTNRIILDYITMLPTTNSLIRPNFEGDFYNGIYDNDKGFMFITEIGSVPFVFTGGSGATTTINLKCKYHSIYYADAIGYATDGKWQCSLGTAIDQLDPPISSFNYVMRSMDESTFTGTKWGFYKVEGWAYLPIVRRG
jgi:hypothetical protein